MKSFLLPMLKLLIGGSLVFWLIDSGKIDLGQLKVFFTSWSVLTTALVHYLLVGIFLGALRLKVLLSSLGVPVSTIRICQLQMIGMFFNVAMPGAVGGDLVKGLYIIKDNQNRSKTQVMMGIIIDRISGMTGLFTIGVIAIALNFSQLWSNTMLHSTLIAVVLFFVAMVVFHLFAIRKTTDENDIFMHLLSKNWPGFAMFKKIYCAFRAFRETPEKLVNAWLLSLVIQFLTLLYFIVITINLIPGFDDYTGLASIFPIGIFTSTLPVSPGGLGVGHLAFEKLFLLIGQNGGANIFNVYVLGYLTLCMAGVLPYLTIKKKVDLTDLDEVEALEAEA